MKFDVVVGNPPYLKNVHLKFLNLAFDICNDNGKIVFLHPSSWLILLREGKTKQKYDLLKNKFNDFTESVEFINLQQWFNYYVIRPYVPLEIIYLNKNKKNKQIQFLNVNKSKVVNSLNEINLIGDFNIIKSIEHKILKFESIQKYINKNPKKFYVNLNKIVGNGYVTVKFFDNITRTFVNRFNLVNSLSNKVTDRPLRSQPRGGKTDGNLKNWVSFETKEEAENFLDFITKSKLCKYLLITYNIDQHINSVYYIIPWLNWKEKLNDEKIYKFFNFTEEEINLIETVVEENKIN